MAVWALTLLQYYNTIRINTAQVRRHENKEHDDKSGVTPLERRGNSLLF